MDESASFDALVIGVNTVDGAAANAVCVLASLGWRTGFFSEIGRRLDRPHCTSTYRVLKAAGLLQRWNPKASHKGNGFQQPLGPHEHWHVDISYLNIVGTFFYLCSVLDGCSRFLLH